MSKYRGVPVQMKQRVLERDGYQCQIGLPGCQGRAVDPDHRCGRGMGGDAGLDAFENLVAACRWCNTMKERIAGVTREELEYRGLRIRRKGRPAELILADARATPVIDPVGRVWRLRADGSRELVRRAAA